ncbi:MAG: 50S ribosomal protein L4 [Gemmatimonadales bacterium]|nr:50S ribosomal protein L4 [Gemmatimonadales bacterium]
MIEAPHYTPAGAKRDASFALPADYFDGTVNEPVLHQAVKVFLNNQRQGTAATKTRSFVSGGNQKPWKQKGTGRARQGSTRAPHWRGGGVVFGPHPRDYRTEIPRKVRQLARKSALNARAREGALHVVERFAFRAPKTAQLAGLLGSLELDGRKVLVLTATANENVYLSGRNLPTIEVMPYFQASAYDILWADAVVVEEGAFTGVMPEPLPDEPETEAKPPRRRGGAAKPAPSRSEGKSSTKPAAKAKAKSAKAAKASKKSDAKAAKKAKPVKKKSGTKAIKAAKPTSGRGGAKSAKKKKGSK